MTEEERQRLFHSYVLLEPEIHVNSAKYLISEHYQEGGVHFYAVHARLQTLGAQAFVPPECWQSCSTGLSLAYLYSTVLETLETACARSGG